MEIEEEPCPPFQRLEDFDPFDEDAFIDGCEKSIERYKASPENTSGLKLQEEFTYKKTVDAITEVMSA